MVRLAAEVAVGVAAMLAGYGLTRNLAVGAAAYAVAAFAWHRITEPVRHRIEVGHANR